MQKITQPDAADKKLSTVSAALCGVAAIYCLFLALVILSITPVFVRFYTSIDTDLPQATLFVVNFKTVLSVGLFVFAIALVIKEILMRKQYGLTLSINTAMLILTSLGFSMYSLSLILPFSLLDHSML